MGHACVIYKPVHSGVVDKRWPMSGCCPSDLTAHRGKLGRILRGGGCSVLSLVGLPFMGSRPNNGFERESRLSSGFDQALPARF